MTDWKKIKNYYITHPKATYRSLADRYGVSLRQISRVAANEKWPALRQQSVDRVSAKALEAAEDRAVERQKKYTETADILLDKVLKSVKKLKAGDIDNAKKLAATLKDIKDVQGIRPDTAAPPELKVTLEGELSDFAV